MNNLRIPICKASLASAVCALFLFAVPCCRQGSSQTSNFTLYGEFSGFIQLGAGAPAGTGGRTATLNAQGTGGVASGAAQNQENFSDSIDFGDLARGDGNPAVGGMGLRVRSNTGFRIVASLVNFEAHNLRYLGKDVTSADNGSFVRMWTGAPTATGPGAASVSALQNNPQLTSGTQLDRIAHGPALAAATTVVAGPVASVSGLTTSVDNAIELPVYFSVPTGLELGPAPGASEGTFAFTVEFGAYGAT